MDALKYYRIADAFTETCVARPALSFFSLDVTDPGMDHNTNIVEKMVECPTINHDRD